MHYLDFLPVRELKAAPELGTKRVRYFLQIGR
uniref:Uncharacterized protein n=1 Tax=Siphoviridae sp. ctM7c3 TaxID=2826257 RepID=A0A8S5M0E8_9CAUD|nr:MAG TPA: hypothetical protein [Siphoviridae sp. ctM7c3]